MSRCHAHPLSIHIPSVIIPCFSLKCCSCASDIKKEEGDCRTWRSTSKVLEKRGGAGEIRHHPTYIGYTTSDTKRRTDSSRLYPYFTGHTTSPTTQDLHSSKRYTDFICHSTSCTTEKSHSKKSTASPPAEDLSQLQRRPIPADWNPIPVIPSLKDNAFNVVRDYVHIFPSWEDYCEDKHHFHIFLSNLRVSAIIHGYYFPVFCWLNTSMIYITLL